MATDERGTKRTCPVTGKKFYDLNKDPVVSPYTGKSYPVSFFDIAPEKVSRVKERERPEEDESEEIEIDAAAQEAGAEVISLEDAEEKDAGDDVPDDVEVEVEDDLGDDDDTFLEDDEDEDGIDFDVEVDEEEER